MIYLLECIMIYLMIATFFKFLALLVMEYPKEVIVRKSHHVVEFTIQLSIIIYYLTLKANQ